VSLPASCGATMSQVRAYGILARPLFLLHYSYPSINEKIQPDTLNPKPSTLNPKP